VKKCGDDRVGIGRCSGNQMGNFDQIVDVGFRRFTLAFLACVFHGGEICGGQDRLDFVVHFSG